MFDSLQEGIIVMQKDRLMFMNDLSAKILNQVSGLGSFFLNTTREGGLSGSSQMDTKLFYCFEFKEQQHSQGKRGKRSR